MVDDAETKHILNFIEQDPQPWSRVGDRDTVARVYFTPKSLLDMREMPEEMRELADAANALGFTAKQENQFGLSGDAIAGGLQWVVLVLGSGAATLIALNAALKSAAELPENWRKLLEKLRAYSRVQLSADLQLEVVHRWLDEVYGATEWRINYDDMLIKSLHNASVFDFCEQQSGNNHRVLVVDRKLTVLTPSRRSSGLATKPVIVEESDRVDLAVITILPEEYQAVISCLDTHEHVRGSDSQPNIYSWEIGTVRGRDGEYTVVVALAGDPTNQIGAVVTQATVEQFDPRYVVLVGIAGGLAAEGQEHGDVVISKTIHGYEYGKLSGGFHPRHDFTHRADPGIANAASALIAAGSNWWSAIQASPPHARLRVNARLGAVASGNKVVDDVEDSFFVAVLQAWPKLLAVEMEGAGAAIAIEAALAKGRQVGFAMIRAISDMPGTGVGTTERDAWKRYAAESAARFLVAVLRERWPVPPRSKHGEFTNQQQQAHAEQLDLQRHALEQQKEILQHQREALDAQVRQQRNATLREAYNPFLTSVARYGNELHAYLMKMLECGCEADIRTRREWQQGCANTHTEIWRTTQPVILVDTDQERGSHRWQLSREVRLEPWVDNAENQKAWIEVILYRIVQRTDHLLALRNLLHREFGEEVTEKTATAKEFDERLFAQAKAKADAVQERIRAQLKELVKAEAVDNRSREV